MSVSSDTKSENVGPISIIVAIIGEGSNPSVNMRAARECLCAL